MKVVVVTPVGPGHERWVDWCRETVTRASRRRRRGPVDEIFHSIILDLKGKGRSLARNRAMERHADADWYFFLDADDEMHPDAFRLFDVYRERNPMVRAFIGSAVLKRKGKEIPHKAEVYPTSREEILAFDSCHGLFAMPGFYGGPECRELWFDEAMDRCESFDFTMAFVMAHDWMKCKSPFAFICPDRPSAWGPRGYRRIDWFKECQPVLDGWKERGPVPLTKDDVARRRASLCE